MADELNVSPWESLELGNRLATMHVLRTERDLDAKRAEHDGDPLHHEVMKLAEESRANRKLMVWTAKVAIDAGLAERMILAREAEGRVVADAIERALTAIGASPSQRLAALTAAHAHLAGEDPPPAGSPPEVIIGEVYDPSLDPGEDEDDGPGTTDLGPTLW